MNEGDIHAEYPDDVDDEDIAEEGYRRPAMPGQCTKLSSALAIFRAARILAKVLDEVYPSTASHALSLRKLGMLSDELDIWFRSLAPRHRLQFDRDRPSTNLVSSSSPVLVRRNFELCSEWKLIRRTDFDVSFHPHSHSSTGNRLQPGLQGCFLGTRRRKLQQKDNSDRAASGGTANELLILPE